MKSDPMSHSRIELLFFQFLPEFSWVFLFSLLDFNLLLIRPSEESRRCYHRSFLLWLLKLHGSLDKEPDLSVWVVLGILVSSCFCGGWLSRTWITAILGCFLWRKPFFPSTKVFLKDSTFYADTFLSRHRYSFTFGRNWHNKMVSFWLNISILLSYV